MKRLVHLVAGMAEAAAVAALFANGYSFCVLLRGKAFDHEFASDLVAFTIEGFHDENGHGPSSGNTEPLLGGATRSPLARVVRGIRPPKLQNCREAGASPAATFPELSTESAKGARKGTEAHKGNRVFGALILAPERHQGSPFALFGLPASTYP